jgi:hypothetical protein
METRADGTSAPLAEAGRLAAARTDPEDPRG